MTADTITVPLAPWSDPKAGTVTVSREDADLVVGVKWYRIRGQESIHRVEALRPGAEKRTARYLAREVLARKFGRELLPGERAYVLDGNQTNLTRDNVVSSTTHKYRLVAVPIESEEVAQ